MNERINNGQYDATVRPTIDPATLSDDELVACIREAAARADRIQAESEARMNTLRSALADPLGPTVNATPITGGSNGMYRR